MFVEFWRHVLVESGFQGCAIREERLARFIVQNQYTKLAQLMHADDPSEWWGAEGFVAAELEAVQGLRRIARKRSRCVFGAVQYWFVLVAQLGRSRPKQKQLPLASVIAQLDQKRPPNSSAAGMGPRAAMQALELRVASPSELSEWLEEARLDAILGASGVGVNCLICVVTCASPGSCSRSHKSVRSGIRCWMSFVGVRVVAHVLSVWRIGWYGQTDSTQYGRGTSRRHWTYCWRGQPCLDQGRHCATT